LCPTKSRIALMHGSPCCEIVAKTKDRRYRVKM
jgi:hypothetical protein